MINLVYFIHLSTSFLLSKGFEICQAEDAMRAVTTNLLPALMMAQVAHSFVATPTAPMSTPALRVAAGPRAAAMPISPISALRPPRAGQRAGLRTGGAPGLHMGTLSERRAVSQ